MDAVNIIHQGELAKYIVTSNRSDFDFDGEYYLEIMYGMMGEKIVISKEEFKKLDDYWVFSFETSKICGNVTARMVMNINGRQEIDEQFIAFVVSTPCPQFMRCKKCDIVNHDVTYRRTEESDIGEKYAIMCDTNGIPIETINDEYLCVLRII